MISINRDKIGNTARWSITSADKIGTKNKLKNRKKNKAARKARKAGRTK